MQAKYSVSTMGGLSFVLQKMKLTDFFKILFACSRNRTAWNVEDSQL